MILILTVIPVFIVVPILIKLTSKGPAVFTQERVGKNGKVFKIYKFRTMRTPEDSIRPDGTVMEPKERITKVGRFLRKTSLDELMQLFNVLFGHMSLVGPRPTIPNQVKKYTEYHHQRHNMRPGVTGLAQVNGRNRLTWAEKIEFDIEYVQNYSLWLDIKILFKTVGVIFARDGIEFKDGSSILPSDKASVGASTENDSSDSAANN